MKKKDPKNQKFFSNEELLQKTGINYKPTIPPSKKANLRKLALIFEGRV